MKFNIIKLLNKGAFSEVYLAKEITNNKFFALKKPINKNLSPQEQYYLQNEIRILKMIEHPNIIKLYYLLKSPYGTDLAIEYCNGGSLSSNLYQYTSKYGKPFSEKLVQRFMKQILSGVNYLHSKGIIHRDLKLGNILLCYSNDNDLKNKNLFAAIVKITDFNISYFPDGHKPQTCLGTPENMAPTVVGNRFMPIHPRTYDEKVDIWSLGTLCYQMLFGKPLFIGLTKEEIYQKIINMNYNIPKTISVQARTFLKHMLRKEGINRLSASQLLNHEFIIGDYHYFNMYKKKEVLIINNNVPPLKINQNNIINKNNNMNNKLDKIVINDPINYKKCNGCGLKCIFDIYYKCLECAEVNYCENCYKKFYKSHKHAFAKAMRRQLVKINNNFDLQKNVLFPKIISFEHNVKKNISPVNNFHKVTPPKIHHCETFY